MNPGRIERTTQICRDGLDATGRKYLVSTGRFALRGIGRAQDLYTLDPDVGADEVVAGSYERYLAP
jgi:adenylate cyclase